MLITFIFETKLGKIIFETKEPWFCKQYQTNTCTFNKDHESFGKLQKHICANCLNYGKILSHPECDCRSAKKSQHKKRAGSCAELEVNSTLSSSGIYDSDELVQSAHTIDGCKKFSNECDDYSRFVYRGRVRSYPSRYFYNSKCNPTTIKALVSRQKSTKVSVSKAEVKCRCWKRTEKYPWGWQSSW